MTLVNNDSVAITSANYPYPYPQNLNCTWDIKSENNTDLIISFQEFNLISQTDSVQLGSKGLFEWTDMLHIRWDQRIYALYLTSDTVQIQINTHYNDEIGTDQNSNSTNIADDISFVDTTQGPIIRGKTGVEMSVMTGQDHIINIDETFDCGNGVVIYSSAICNSIDDCFNFLDEQGCEYPECSSPNPTTPNDRRCRMEKGTVSSPGYPKPYLKDAVWTWQIITDPNTYISFQILDFDVPSETAGSECYYAYLGFYDTIVAGIAGDIGDRKQYFCHRRLPTLDPILSPFNELFVVFRSGSVTPGRGFKAEYKSIQFRTSIHFNISTHDGE
ncbi:bone morphogenetic protein 1-like [Amphiura filiformis]|uniref:bone morphogenetic protein 1-like n=1 Tax=Amphiura filiformis TaxID=82378 RepID=UPI003B217A6C